ncbi:MAG: hypothetical protein EBR10_08405 [Planctomycetes bacterium]|nr:hypothetical protein [Planctomycetota bacterium]
MNRYAARNILPSVLLLAGCAGAPEVVLESDVPNVSGYEPLVTRNLLREEGRIAGVEVLYRGDIDDPIRQVNETQSRFSAQGWTLVSKQARAAATVLNFRKDSRSARVEIAMNQLDPMTSPAHLQVFPTPPAPPPVSWTSSMPNGGAATSAPPQSQPAAATAHTPIEGFAPPTR